MHTYATRDGRKAARQAAILEAISKEDIGTQNDLAGALGRRGIHANQVSVSRDIAELGLIKVAGFYKPAPAQAGAADPELPLRTSLKKAQSAGPNLVVASCDAGTAQKIALVLDGLSLPGLVGTIAGDDTVFIAVSSAAAGRRVMGFLGARIQKP